MGEVAVEVVHKLPAWYLELMLPVLAAAGIWVFSRLKRDKQGKMYWFSRTYEDKKLVKKLDGIMAEAENVNRRVSRLELLEMINHHPEEKEIILSQYDSYHKDGYNSYMDDFVDAWKRKCLKKRKVSV